MCLYTTIQQEPLEVKRNIHCYKELRKTREGKYETPYMNIPVTFKNGYFIQTASEFGIKKWENCSHRWGTPKKYAYDIYEGIHSFMKYTNINITLYRFHAVIPKHTQTFFSDGYWRKDDWPILCASLKLIVFKSYWYYLKYKLGLLKIEV